MKTSSRALWVAVAVACVAGALAAKKAAPAPAPAPGLFDGLLSKGVAGALAAGCAFGLLVAAPSSPLAWLAVAVVLPPAYLHALAELVRGAASDAAGVPALLKLFGGPTLTFGHWRISSAAVKPGGRDAVDALYMSGTVSLSVAMTCGAKLAGDGGVAWVPTAVALAGAFFAVSFAKLAGSLTALRSKPTPVRALVCAAFVGGCALSSVGLISIFVNRGLLAAARKAVAPHVTMFASSCFLAANSLKLATLTPGKPGYGGGCLKVLGSAFLFSGNAIGLGWHTYAPFLSSLA